MLLNSIGLGKHLTELREHFLPAKKVTELGKPDNFEQDLDARAYLLLAHSAFEQFIEDTARAFSNSAVDRWVSGLTPTRQQIVTLCCLASTQGDLAKQLAIETTQDEIVGDTKKGAEKLLIETNPRIKVTDSLEIGRKNFETVLEKNHGADLHYLRMIFPVIGVFIDPSPDARSALSQIANARGTFAHRRTASKKGKFAYKPIAAETALLKVETLFSWCIDFEKRLRDSLRPDYSKILTKAKKELVEALVASLKHLALRLPVHPIIVPTLPVAKAITPAAKI